MDDATRMRLVGGNLGLDLVNTRSGPPDGAPDDDVLSSYDEFVSWAEYAGAIPLGEAARLRRLAEKDPEGAKVMLARVLRVRDDLDSVFRALAHGDDADAAVLARIRDDESDALRAGRLESGVAFTWDWSGDDSLDRPLWPAVHAAIGILLRGPLDRIKQCGGCSFLFLDESKNRSRRWCSMDDCGTDEKMRRYVASRRAARDAGVGPRASIKSPHVP